MTQTRTPPPATPPAAQCPPRGATFAAARPALRARLEDLGMRWASGAGVLLHRALGRRTGARPGILTYHRVAPHAPGLPPPLHNVDPGRFREQLAGLRRRGFAFRPLREVLARHGRGEPLPPRTAAVTFDDGFESVYLHAWPVLRELGVPATVFVNTAYLGGEDPFPFDAWGVAWAGQAPPEAYRPLRVGQCREMAASGLVELGAHTHTHEDFRGRPQALRRDLEANLAALEELFGVTAPTFAFPYGSPHLGFAAPELAEQVRAAGCVCALTTGPDVVHPGESPFRWGRFNAFPWDTGATLAAKLDGWYSWAPRLKQRLARMLDPRPRRYSP